MPLYPNFLSYPVAAAPGAEFGPAKRWPARHFVELMLRLELTVVLLGSAKERDLCGEIADLVNAEQPGKCRNLAGETSLAQAFRVIAASECLVSNDSSLMHVGAALGVRQVAILAGHSACTAGVAEQAGKLKAEFYRERGMGQTVGMGMKVKASVTAGGPRGTQLAPDPLWVNSQHGQLLF